MRLYGEVKIGRLHKISLPNAHNLIGHLTLVCIVTNMLNDRIRENYVKVVGFKFTHKPGIAKATVNAHVVFFIYSI